MSPEMIPWLQNPPPAPAQPASPDLTDAEVAGLFRSAMLKRPPIEQAGVMNRLLHGQPRIFTALLLHFPDPPAE